MGKCWDKIQQWNFDRKIKVLTSSFLVGTALLVLVVSSTSSIQTVISQSQALLQEQNRAVAAGFETSLNNYKALAYGVTMAAPVQRSLETPSLSDVDNAKNTLQSMLNVYSSLNFLALINKDGDTIYKGNEAPIYSRFDDVWLWDYSGCPYVLGTSMRLSFGTSYYGDGRSTLSIYFPVYDVNKIGRVRGLLCMNFSDKTLEQVMEYRDSSMHSAVAVVDEQGGFVAASAEMGKDPVNWQKLKGVNGSFQDNGKYYFYQRIKGWPFYVVSTVSVNDLFASERRTVFLLLVMVAGLLFISLISVSRSIRLLYRPLDQVIRQMDAVAQGSLESRLNVAHMGSDFKKLAGGFNSMMEKISLLMEQVKEEQHELEQIRLHALQSQIKPHFLYNTLECVHWQAVADGNQEISTLVKALARYYRICLSGGQDVIPLSEEAEHVTCYLVIQNMRYGNIISSSIEVPEELREVLIPKITLQPLVENSIYHGIKVKEGKHGSVALQGVREGKDVWLTLSDTGTGMTDVQLEQLNRSLLSPEESMGYGVSNVHRRIQLLYGAEYGLKYSRNEAGGITVTIHLPFTEKNNPEGEIDVSGIDRR